jgi:hypothetical protein
LPNLLVWLMLIHSQWYGRIEVAFGLLKVYFVISTFVVMLTINNISTVPMHHLARA